MLVFVTGILVGLACLLFGRPLVGGLFLNNDPDSVRIAMARMKIIAPVYFLCGTMDVMTGVLRGMGTSFTPSIITLVGALGTRVLWTFVIWPKFEVMHYFFANLVGNGDVMAGSLAWLYMCYPLSWGLTLLAQIVFGFILYSSLKRKYVAQRWKSNIGAYILPPAVFPRRTFGGTGTYT